MFGLDHICTEGYTAYTMQNIDLYRMVKLSGFKSDLHLWSLQHNPLLIAPTGLPFPLL